MKFKILILVLTLIAFNGILAQDKDDKKAERLYQKYSAQAIEENNEGDFVQAEALYRKALDKNPQGDKAAYNFGNLYFENQKNKTSAQRYIESAKASEDKDVKHRNFHNLGNLMMEEEQYPKAIEAYKNALRNNPNDEETRYNLALAKQKQEQEKNEGGGDDKNKDEQNKDSKDKDKDKGGEGDKDEKEKDQEKSKEGDQEKENKQPQDDAKKDPKEGDQDKQEQPSKPEPQKGKMSEQQIKNLLQAIQNKEKNTQEKMNAEKVKGVKVKTEKDW